MGGYLQVASLAGVALPWIEDPSLRRWIRFILASLKIF